MSKLIQAINTMIINSDKISEGIVYKGEYFFRYMSYVWSIKPSDFNRDYFILTYYPNYSSVLNLKADMQNKADMHLGTTVKSINKSPSEKLRDKLLNYTSDIKPAGIVTYNSESYKTKEAIESFRDLYKTVSEKLYDVDNVLDDIISSR